MTRLIIKRLIAGILTIACVYTLTFVMVVTIPGNPFQQGGRNLSPQVVEALQARYNMDNNWLYYWQFLSGALHFDFGPTYMYTDWTCNQLIASALPVSVTIGLLAVVLAVLIGVPLGVFSAMHKAGWFDVVTLVFVSASISIPSFVVGSVLLIVFGVWWPIAPIGGWGSLSHLPLPVLALSLPFIAYITRLTRAGMLDALDEDFIRTALAKGLSRNQAAWKHGLRIAFLPVLTYLGPATAQAMTGSFVVEKVFAVPGLGQHFVNAALNLDAGLILASVLVFASLLVALNIVVDVLYAFLDPRIRGAL